MYPGYIEDRIHDALTHTRVVLVSGPRQSGKTTLAKQIASRNIPFLNLDDKTTLDAALADPVSFIRGLDRAVIDEIQRAPDLLLAIKTAVDADPRPGRFLLTGSANLMTVPRVADSLAGRMKVVRLLPLAQAELKGGPSAFLDTAFKGQVPKISQGLRLTKALLNEAGMHVGDEVNVSVQNGRIIVEHVPRVRGKFDLETLLSEMPEEYRPEELDWGPSTGKEIW